MEILTYKFEGYNNLRFRKNYYIFGEDISQIF